MISKHRYSAFFETRLDSILRARRIETLIFTGATTSMCVESTVRDATFRDYRCIVLRDCTTELIASDAPRTNHDASLLTIELLFDKGTNQVKAEVVYAVHQYAAADDHGSGPHYGEANKEIGHSNDNAASDRSTEAGALPALAQGEGLASNLL